MAVTGRCIAVLVLALAALSSCEGRALQQATDARCPAGFTFVDYNTVNQATFQAYAQQSLALLVSKQPNFAATCPTYAVQSIGFQFICSQAVTGGINYILNFDPVYTCGPSSQSFVVQSCVFVATAGTVGVNGVSALTASSIFGSVTLGVFSVSQTLPQCAATPPPVTATCSGFTIPAPRTGTLTGTLCQGSPDLAQAVCQAKSFATGNYVVPSRPNCYAACSCAGAWLMPCPSNLVFNEAINQCVYP